MMDVNERLIGKTFYFEYVLETYEAYVDYLMHLTCAGGPIYFLMQLLKTHHF